MFSEEEKAELLMAAQSETLRRDMRIIAQNRHNPFMLNGKIDLDRVVTFLTELNGFLGHPVKPFRKIIDKKMLL